MINPFEKYLVGDPAGARTIFFLSPKWEEAKNHTLADPALCTLEWVMKNMTAVEIKTLLNFNRVTYTKDECKLFI
jgi:hypothetical protein